MLKENKLSMLSMKELKYGNSEFQTFDYPAGRYYGFTYPNMYKKD